MNLNLREILIYMNKFTKGYKAKISIGIMIYFLFSMCSALSPILTKYLIDTIAYDPSNIGILKKLLIMTFVILAVLTISNIISNYILNKAFQDINSKVKINVYNKLSNVSENFFQQKSGGDIVYRINYDIESINSILNMLLVNMPNNILLTIIYYCILISWNIELTLMVSLLLALQFFIINILKKKLNLNYIQQKNYSQSLFATMNESIMSRTLIKGINVEYSFKFKIESYIHAIKKLNINTSFITNIIIAIAAFINNLWSFVILGYGGILISNNKITLGSLISFLMLVGMLYPKVTGLFSNILEYQQMKVSLMRFIDYYRELEDKVIKTGNERFIDGDIVVNSLNYKYADDINVLNNFNILIKSKKINLIQGNNGCGKSTICKLIARLLHSKCGEISIGGIDVNCLDEHELRNNVMYQPQNEFVIKGTILENIVCSNKEHDIKKVESCLDRAKLLEVVKRLPKGIHSNIEECGKNLSGGQMQRIVLARVYYNMPKIIILDEPTSFIDEKGKDILKEMFSEMKSKSTFIIVSHDKEIENLSDNIIKIDDSISEDKKEKITC